MRNSSRMDGSTRSARVQVVTHSSTGHRSSRSGDVIGRLGGDEFGVLLRRVSEQEAAAVAAGVIEAIAERLDMLSAGRLPGVGTSVGIASLEREQPETIDDWLNAADAAMYRAKASGGDAALLA